MASPTGFSLVARRFLDGQQLPEPLVNVLNAVAEASGFADAEAIPAETAEDVKGSAVQFLLECVGHALEDHDLTDVEMAELIRLKRILRIQEGDISKWCPREAAEVLGREIGRVLEDQQVDPQEALHKVKLQELFGMSYDEFLDITAPIIDHVLINLAKQIDPEGDGVVLEDELEWYHRRIAALDTAYGLTPQLRVRSSASGYLYLLANSSMPGLYKIGRTSRDPKSRTAELADATGVPTPFILLFARFTADCHRAERLAHGVLADEGFRVTDNREFFAIDADIAIGIIIEACARATNEPQQLR